MLLDKIFVIVWDERNGNEEVYGYKIKKFLFINLEIKK